MYFFFLISVLIVFIIEWKLWRTLTPTIISFGGVAVISLIHATVGRYMGFFDVNPMVYLYISGFLFTSFFSSLIVFFIFNLSRNKITTSEVYSDNFFLSHAPKDQRINNYRKDYNLIGPLFKSRNINNTFLIFVFTMLCFIFYSVLKAYFRLGVITGEAFENELSFGVVGHAFALLMACLPFLYILSKSAYSANLKKISMIFLIVSLSLLFMKQIKYWVLVPVIWLSLIYFKIYSHRISVSFLVKLFWIFLICVALFYSVYLFQILYWSGFSGGEIKESSMSIVYHMFGYMFSGIMTFSSLIEDGLLNELMYRDIGVAFQGLSNILAILSGGSLYAGEIFTINFYVLDSVYQKTGNVPTIWGDFLLYLGFFSYPIYFILYFIIYCLLVASRFSPIIFFYYTGLVSFLFFSWFASYFKLLSIYEVPLLSMVVATMVVLFHKASGSYK